MMKSNVVADIIGDQKIAVIERETGIPRSTIENWLYRDVSPPFDKLQKVCIAAGYEIKFKKVSKPSEISGDS